MGNSQTQTPSPSDPKSLSQINSDVARLNKLLGNPELIKHLGCQLHVESFSFTELLFQSIFCGSSAGPLLRLEIRKQGRIEEIGLRLSSFERLNRIVNNYSEVISNTTPGRNSKQKSLQSLPTADDEKLFINEEGICVICFKNPVQLLLWCKHGYCEECCNSWFEERKKRECPMCRKKATKNWKMSISRLDPGLQLKAQLVTFVNKKTMFLKLK